MRQLITYMLLLVGISLSAQTVPKQLPAQRTTGVIKIDGSLDEAEWKTAKPATGFIEWRPNAGVQEDTASRTEVYLLYDNTSVYIGGFCYERTKDSISRELIGRDRVGVNDFVGVILDTYNDKINAVGFYVTPYGEQFDAKYSNTSGEDDSWNAVWDSEAKIHSNGWSFEMRIPYSALRFVSKENQTWGMNITRRRNKTGQQFMWSPIDPKVNGFVNQEGLWTGIEKIEAPVRLSFSPYLSAYTNHNRLDKKQWQNTINGGMDVKYGISESFTLDMTLIPDFGQVRSDNRILNLSPFEQRFQENRPFFTEGTELFNKGNLFYSRRIGTETPMHYYTVESQIGANDIILENPGQAKLVNATKISGRTQKGLGIGVFNAVTKPMYAKIQNASKETYEIQTSPLINYNIVVFDQTLKNNSSVSFINTNVLRSGQDYDANVSAALFDFNNKKNTFNWNGKFSVSQLSSPTDKHTNGYSHALGFGKTGGRWMFNVSQELSDDKYNIRDMGYYNNNNFIDHYFWTGYRWLKPKKWYNRIGVNYNATLSRRYNPGDYQVFYTNVNANAQLKNLWFVGAFVGFNAAGNDFYEPRIPNRFFRTPQSMRYNFWIETNSAKKYSGGGSLFMATNQQYSGRNFNYNVWHKYRFSDKFSLSQSVFFGPSYNDAGFYDINNGAIRFSLRDRNTVENSFEAKYSFNNKSGINLIARHYWSKVNNKSFYLLKDDGNLSNTAEPTNIVDRNYNDFYINIVYTRQFAPGSFINIVWKDEANNFDMGATMPYFKNLDRTLSRPQNNNLSIKITYFLDYLDFKKWRKKK